MPDIQQMTSDLRGLPDQALQSELQNPTGLIPSYLVLAEAQRRQLMRTAAQKQQQQGQSGSVLDDIVRNMMAQQPQQQGLPAAPVGMVPPRQQQQPMPGAAPPQQMGMARGGPIRLADGSDSDNIVEMGGTAMPGAMSPSNVDDWIDKYTQQYNAGQQYPVEPDMVRAIMQQESGKKGQRARSSAGAIGMMQLMPGTAQDMGVDPYNAEQNVKGGIGYFSKMLNRYSGNVPVALAAYNAGPGTVDRYGGVPPFDETTKYVSRVQGNYNRLRAGSTTTPSTISPSARQLLSQVQTTPQDSTATPGTSAQAGSNATPPGLAPQVLDVDIPGIGMAGIPMGSPPAAPEAARSADADTDADTVFTAHSPGKIHQLIGESDKVIGELQRRLQPRSADNPNGLIDPYGDENIATQKKIVPAVYGVGNDYLANLSQQADTRAATLEQLQGEIMQRYHNPSPWEFLANIAAGMGASHQLNLPGMFSQGVGLAWQVRDQQQHQMLQDYDLLQKQKDAIYNNVENERGRMGQTLTGLLEHQATITDANRKSLQDQLKVALAEKEKLQQRLIPTNKLEPLTNPDDYSTEEVNNAFKYLTDKRGWNKDQQAMQRAALQALAARGDQWVPTGQWGSPYDQFLAKYPKEAQALDVKPSKYSPQDLKMFAEGVNAAPDTLYDPKVVPKDAQPFVRGYMADHNMQVPVRPPNKALHDSAAVADRALIHVDRIMQWAKDPWMVNNVFGPVMGRAAQGEQKVGMNIPGASKQQTEDAQNLLTSLNYLTMIEGKALLGGRPAQTLMQVLMETSPNVNMKIDRFMGALKAVQASANMAKQSDRGYMFAGNPINAVPATGTIAVDPNRRQVMQSAPGQPWYYMDTGEEYKAPK